MKRNTTIYFLVVLAILFLLHHSISAQQKSLVDARLVVDTYSLNNDSTISLGVLIDLKDDWHIYWRNPGDSGLPTDIELRLPKGITASEVKYPIPKIFASDEIVNYGYGHQVLFLFDVKVPGNYSSEEIDISVKINSLICKEMCKAFDTTVTISLDMSKDFTAEESISRLFVSTRKMIPKQNQNLNIIAESNSHNVYLKVFVNQNENQNIKSIQFYPYEEGVFRNLVKQNTKQKESFWELLLDPDQFRIKEPALVNGIIIIEEEIEYELSRKAYEITVPIIKLK